MFPILSVGFVHFYTFPIVIFLSFTVCSVYYTHSKSYSPLYHYSVFRMCVPAMFSAAVGGRLLSAIVLTATGNGAFFSNLIYGGSVFYGGLTGSVCGLYIACKIRKLDVLDYMDVLATILPLGHSIARLGCFLNGCCYGREYYGPFAILYPVAGKTTSIFPTWFAESAFSFSLFLYFLFCGSKWSGSYAGSYFVAYASFRFLIEFMRGDDIRGFFGLLSTSQYISIFYIIVGIWLLYKSAKRHMPNYMIKKDGSRRNQHEPFSFSR